MTLKELAELPQDTLNIAHVASVLNSDPQNIRVQIKQDIKSGVNSFGFPVIVIGARIKIPKLPFLRFMGLDI